VAADFAAAGGFPATAAFGLVGAPLVATGFGDACFATGFSPRDFGAAGLDAGAAAWRLATVLVPATRLPLELWSIALALCRARKLPEGLAAVNIGSGLRDGS
jgi:hypothetical protein